MMPDWTNVRFHGGSLNSQQCMMKPHAENFNGRYIEWRPRVLDGVVFEFVELYIPLVQEPACTIFYLHQVEYADPRRPVN
jgi:hypothetical protein